VRYWTEPEARAYLPRAKRLVEVIRRAALLEVRARGNGHATMPSQSHDTDHTDHADQTDSPDNADNRRGPDVESALRELDDQGVIVRDPHKGLIDFPARHPGGRDVLLCWQLGEDDLAWWHLPEDGFAGRRPLPLPPEL
jgi:hypothetical protein